MATTSKRGQVKRFQIESQAIYYRKKYHCGMVVWNPFLIDLFDFPTLIKKIPVHEAGPSFSRTCSAT
jgi:hypothetical protein